MRASKIITNEITFINVFFRVFVYLEFCYGNFVYVFYELFVYKNKNKNSLIFYFVKNYNKHLILFMYKFVLRIMLLETTVFYVTKDL